MHKFRKSKLHLYLSVFGACILTLFLNSCGGSSGSSPMGHPINNIPCRSVEVKDKLVDYLNQLPAILKVESEDKEEKKFKITTNWIKDDPRPPRRERDVQYIIAIDDNGDTTNVNLSWNGRARGIREEKYQENVEIDYPKLEKELVVKIKNICGALQTK